MGRKRTKLTLPTAESAQLKAQIRAATDPRDKERLQVVKWATSGQPTLADLPSAGLPNGASARSGCTRRRMQFCDTAD